MSVLGAGFFGPTEGEKRRRQQVANQPRPDAMAYYVGSHDPFDKFPWTVSLYSDDFQDMPDGHRKAFVSTPNGKRVDGGQHTYWSVLSDVWEPIAVIICKAVNAEAHARYGTPNPPSVYADEWRSTVAATCTDPDG